jgi:hypothetical protein
VFLDQRALAPAEEPDSSWLALLFAVLACGVQFSDDPIKERDLRSKVLSKLALLGREEGVLTRGSLLVDAVSAHVQLLQPDESGPDPGHGAHWALLAE